MSEPEFMPIGAFARLCGLTPSALRFYADSGLLPPAHIDPASGYRLYAAGQVEHGLLVRRLREIGLPLASAQLVLEAGPTEASRLIDQHIDALVADASAARRRAAVIKSSLAVEPPRRIATVWGPALTVAIDQVLTAVTCDAEFSVLNCVFFEVDSDAMTLTATDRYRLATRTLLPTEPAPGTWSASVHADDLRGVVADLRRTPHVRLEAADHGLWFCLPEREDHYCRFVAEPFPDYRRMLGALDPVTTRAVVSKSLFLAALQQHSAHCVMLRAEPAGLAVADSGQARDGFGAVPADVTGDPVSIWFETTTLYPAVANAIGADLLLDFRGVDQPATLRSADHGDLTILAMPASAPGNEEGSC